MKTLSRMFCFLTAFSLAALLGRIPVSGAEVRYLSNFPEGVRTWIVQLPAPVEKTTYKNAFAAIYIEAVICDGAAVAPELRWIAGRVDRRVMDVGECEVIYQFDPAFLECWANIDATASTNEVRQFKIREGVKVVEVRYRVRRPSGGVSELLTAKFYANAYEIHIFAVPPDAK